MLGRSTRPLLRENGHDVVAPLRTQLDLFGAEAVAAAVADADAVVHLATRIPNLAARRKRETWRENDRLREEASRLLVDASLAADVRTYVQPTVTFVYPAFGPVDEETSPTEVPDILRSALAAEAETARFAAAGRHGVVLRLGLLYGPGTDSASADWSFGATLHVADAGRALVAALRVPSGIYNVCRDDERVSNERFERVSGWSPHK